jgi:dTDP-4-dehydrorhamnose 3,5-epimerase
MTLPQGLLIRDLEPHHDDRGSFTELHRLEWDSGIAPVQWNAVRSAAGVLRGVHVHPRHDDYLTVFAGRATIGLRDLRPDAPTWGLATTVELDGERPQAVTIPHGVAHGFYFPVASVHIYAVSEYFDSADELGCRWDDPALEIPWEPATPQISPRDAALPSLRELVDTLARRGWDGQRATVSQP